MTEKALNETLRELRMSVNYLNFAADIADKVMHNHVVASKIKVQSIEVKDIINDLDTTYRGAHYQKQTGYKHGR